MDRFYRIRIFCLFVVFFGTIAAPDSFAVEVKSVVSEGVGLDPENAAKNAAENALTQVVGSFVTTERMLEKRKEIRDGIKSQVKSIKSSIAEYSQGAIESFEVIELRHENGLTYLTANVEVRIEDFKHYMKDFVVAESAMPTGLLGQLQAERDQSKDLFKIVTEKVLQPIVDGSVLIPSVGNIEIEKRDFVIDRFHSHDPIKDDEFIIRFPVAISIDPAFLSKARVVLTDISAKHLKPPFEGRTDFSEERGIVIGIGEVYGGNRKKTHGYDARLGFHYHKFKTFATSAPEYFISSAVSPDLCERVNEYVVKNIYRNRGRRESNNLSLRFRLVSGDGVDQQVFGMMRVNPGTAFTIKGGLNRGELYVMHVYEEYVDGGLNWDSSNGENPTELLFYGGGSCPEVALVLITPKTKFEVVMRVKEGVLKKTEKILVQYAQ